MFESRAKALESIAAGLVTVDGRQIAKASTIVAEGARIEAFALHPYVSRGGVKLAAGLDAFAIDPAGKRCLDVGAATGGFTDVLLRRDAAHVFAVDVGRAQFHASLRRDPRVTLREETDIRTFVDEGNGFDLVVCDASFVSLRIVLPPALAQARARAEIVVLVKPQFEAGRAALKKGIVRDPEVHVAVCRNAEALVAGMGWDVLGVVPSPIAGGDGNREFLLGARRRAA